MSICIVDGCDRPWRSRRLCDLHYMRQWTRQHAYGTWESSLTDAQPARDHITALQAAGVSWKRLHELSGVPLSSIARIVIGRTERGEGPAKQISRECEAKILAVTVPSVWWVKAAGSRVGDQTGTTRRLRALVAIGWSQSELARRLGWSAANAGTLFAGERQVQARTARAVAALYDELSMTPGGSSRAVNRAARLGWWKPLDWDDDELDNPDWVPGTEDVSGVEGRLDDFRWLLRCGVHPMVAAQRCGWRTWDGVTYAHRRAGRELPVNRDGSMREAS